MIKLKKIEHKSANEVLVTVDADTYQELVADDIRKTIQDMVADKHGLTGYGLEPTSQPYPFDSKSGKEPPPIVEGNAPLFAKNAAVKYRQVYRFRRGL